MLPLAGLKLMAQRRCALHIHCPLCMVKTCLKLGHFTVWTALVTYLSEIGGNKYKADLNLVLLVGWLSEWRSWERKYYVFIHFSNLCSAIFFRKRKSEYLVYHNFIMQLTSVISLSLLLNRMRKDIKYINFIFIVFSFKFYYFL